MPAKVRKAVFPAAGLGTRFLPATKAQPKEMLPLVDKPIIQYGVEEAMHSGIQNIIIVTGRGKTAIEDHFDVSFELEHLLESRKKKDLLAIVHSISDMINVSYVRQKEALGLGHAVLRAVELVGDEPFAVVLADDVIEAETPCLRQLLDIYDFFSAPVLAVMEVPQGEHLRLRLHRRRTGLPQRQQRPRLPHPRPGRKAEACRRAVEPGHHRPLRADARDLRIAASIDPGSGGEIQLTDALRHLLRSRPIYAVRFDGTRYDAGDKLGFLKATVEFALRRHDLGAQFREYLKGLKL